MEGLRMRNRSLWHCRMEEHVPSQTSVVRDERIDQVLAAALGELTVGKGS